MFVPSVYRSFDRIQSFRTTVCQQMSATTRAEAPHNRGVLGRGRARRLAVASPRKRLLDRDEVLRRRVIAGVISGAPPDSSGRLHTPACGTPPSMDAFPDAHSAISLSDLYDNIVVVYSLCDVCVKKKNATQEEEGRKKEREERRRSPHQEKKEEP